MSIAGTLAPAADFALNTYISPVYSKQANRARAPGQPTPGAFAIWFPIYAGRVLQSLNSDLSEQATVWNNAIALTGFGYAWSLVSRQFLVMQGTMLAMNGAMFMYRRALGESSAAGAADKFIKFTAELGVGWLAAANLIVAAQNTRRTLGRPLTHREQDSVGAAEAIALTGVAVAANRVLGWSGVSAAAAWALGGIALDSKSEKHVRTLAGVAAVGVLADLALKTFGGIRESDAISAADEMEDDTDFAVLVEDTFIPPNIIVEEVTTLRM